MALSKRGDMSGQGTKQQSNEAFELIFDKTPLFVTVKKLEPQNGNGSSDIGVEVVCKDPSKLADKALKVFSQAIIYHSDAPDYFIPNTKTDLPKSVEFTSFIIKELRKKGFLEKEETNFEFMACPTLINDMKIAPSNTLIIYLDVNLKLLQKKPHQTYLQRERGLAETLVSEDYDHIQQVLDLVDKTESTWTLNLLKYAISVREDVLHVQYEQDNSTNFEGQGQFWYEASWNKKEKKKFKMAITTQLPKRFRDWLDEFKIKRQKLKKI